MKIRYDDKIKEILENLCLPHKMDSGYIPPRFGTGRDLV